ncbi:NADPH dehydrogenase [compost metagenome]
MGYDYLHLTSGGNVATARIPGAEPGYQVAFAEAVKTAVPEANVMAVGMIVTPQQAEDLLTEGKTDLIAVARAVLDDPNWGHHAAVALGQPEALPVQYERAGAAHWPGYAAARTSAG